MAQVSAQAPVRIARLPIIFRSAKPDNDTCIGLEVKFARAVHIPLNGTLKVAEYIPPVNAAKVLGEMWRAMRIVDKKSKIQNALRPLAEELDADLIVCPILLNYSQHVGGAFTATEIYLDNQVCTQLIQANPAAYIKVPKNAPRNVVKRKIITLEQFDEVLSVSWSDVDFNRYIMVDDFLLRELERWQVQQLENERICGDSYVYIYREADGHIERRSKSFKPDGEVSPVCTRDDGRIILRNHFTRTLTAEGLNAHLFRHT